MTEAEVRGFCQNNGVNVSPIGSPLRVLDPTELPASVREFVNEDGTYKGSGKPEAKDLDHEQSKGALDADETRVTKMPGDTLEDVEAREAEGDKKPQGKLPPDFPGHAALEAEGINTYAQLRKAGDVTAIPGIGEATAAKIADALGTE